MIDIQTGVALCAIKEFEDGLPTVAPSGCRAIRTTSGVKMLNEIGRRIANNIEHEACAMMSTATQAQAIDWLYFIGYVEDNIALSNVYDAFFCTAVKIAALRLISLPTQMPIELKEVAV